MIYLLFLIVLLVLFLYTDNPEAFTSSSINLTGTDDDLQYIAKETMGDKYSKCSLNANTDNGTQVILSTSDNHMYTTCDYGLLNSSNDCTDIIGNKLTNNKKIIPVKTINNETRCRIFPYNGPIN